MIAPILSNALRILRRIRTLYIDVLCQHEIIEFQRNNSKRCLFPVGRCPSRWWQLCHYSQHLCLTTHFQLLSRASCSGKDALLHRSPTSSRHCLLMTSLRWPPCRIQRDYFAYHGLLLGFPYSRWVSSGGERSSASTFLHRKYFTADFSPDFFSSLGWLLKCRMRHRSTCYRCWPSHPARFYNTYDLNEVWMNPA